MFVWKDERQKSKTGKHMCMLHWVEESLQVLQSVQSTVIPILHPAGQRNSLPHAGNKARKAQEGGGERKAFAEGWEGIPDQQQPALREKRNQPPVAAVSEANERGDPSEEGEVFAQRYSKVHHAQWTTNRLAREKTRRVVGVLQTRKYF